MKLSFDGTAAFADDAAHDDTTPTTYAAEDTGAHTAGLDDSAANRVVRTYDQYGYRIDYNVNEDAGTNVVLTVRLTGADADAANIRWNEDPDMADAGWFTGCIPEGPGSATDISDDGQALVCDLGVLAEGTHGTIYPTVKLTNGVDTTEIGANVTMTADGSADATSTPDSVFVSEAPSGNWIKETPLVSAPVTVGTTPRTGYVVLFPVGLVDTTVTAAPVKGAGAMDRSQDIVFYDHFWDLAGINPANINVNTIRRAQPAEVVAAGFHGEWCGRYDAGNGGKLPGDVATDATWSCSNQLYTNGYPSLQITVDGGSWNVPVPATNADGSANTRGYVLTGQLAFWIDAPTVQAVWENGASFTNTITNTPQSTAITSTTDAQPIPVDTSETPDALEEKTTDNSSGFALAPPEAGGGSSGVVPPFTSHYGLIQSKYEQQRFSVTVNGEKWNPENPAVYQNAHGNLLTGQSAVWDGRGTVSRGQPVALQMQVGAYTNATDASPIHGCMVLDDRQLKISDMNPYPTRMLTESFSQVKWGYREPTFPMAQLVVGPSTGGSMVAGAGQAGRLIDLTAEQLAVYGIKLQFAYDPTVMVDPNPLLAANDKATGNVAENSVECNDRVGRTWVDADNAVAVGGQYHYNMVRVIMTGSEPFPWYDYTGYPKLQGGASVGMTGGMFLSVQAKVGTDIDINHDGKSLYVHTSRGSGAWSGGKPSATSCHNAASYINNSRNRDYWDGPGTTDGLNPTTTGWCNQAYRIASENALDSTEISALDQNNFTFYGVSGQALDSDTDRVTIVAVRPDVTKTNVNGLADIADNDDEVTYRLDVGAIGSSYEALTNVTLSDPLDQRYEFVSVTDPHTPGASCAYVSASHSLECRFSTADPTVADGDLPLGLPGGSEPADATAPNFAAGERWVDSVEVTVRVTGAEALSTVGYTEIPNTATINSGGIGPWDPTLATPTFLAGGTIDNDQPQHDSSRASSWIPLPAAQGAIIKAVPELLGRCTTHPDGDLTPAQLLDWQRRCSIISDDADPVDPAPTATDGDGNGSFVLSYSNSGNTRLHNVRFVDVLPYNGDGPTPVPAEPDSGSIANGVTPDQQTDGDGRTPASNFTGSIGLVGVDGATSYWVTAASPESVSRDPDAAFSETQALGSETVWCDAVGGSPVPGSPAGACPLTPFQVTAVYVFVAEELAPSATAAVTVNIDTEGSQCEQLYTNTFGARVDGLGIDLPIRSNDVSLMTADCQYDLALRKTVESSWSPGGADTAPWLTYGESTVTFNIEVFNQGDPVEQIDVTDYVDTSVFSFDPMDNPAGTTGGPSSTGYTQPTSALDYAWTYTAGSDPVVHLSGGVLGHNESVVVPVTLRVEALPTGALRNFAEISRFDNDADSGNGDSSTGAITDVDSTPDGTDDNDELIDNEIDSTPDSTPPDEDDHDVAEVPWYDLALVKDLSDGQLPTLDGSQDPLTVSFDIRVKNQSPFPVTDVTVTDVPPAGLTLGADTAASQTSGGSTITNNGDNTFTIDAMEAGQEVVFTVVYDVDVAAMAAAGGTVSNSAEISEFFDAAGNTQPDVDSDPDTDPNNDAYLDPEGGRAEGDGGESPDFDGDADDDLHNRGSADEDDQDWEPVSLLYSLGNEVWYDTNNNGTIDEGENPIAGVRVELYAADELGNPIGEPLLVDVTDENGLYLFSNLPAGNYIVVIPGSNAAAGGPLEHLRSSDPTEDDPNADVDGNDNGILDGTLVRSGIVTLGGVEPTGEDPDNDENADVLSNLTVDFGFYMPLFDLALRKTLAEGQAEIVNVGDLVTFDITVFNQGDVAGADLEVTDYIPTQLELADEDWTAVGDDQATIRIPGPLGPDESTVVQITFKVVVGGKIDNYAEISEQTPVDSEGATVTDIAGTPIPDIDSVPDRENTDILIDDEIDLTPATGDEDDHDIASIRTPPVIDIEKWNTNQGPVAGDHDNDAYAAGATENVALTFTITNTGDEPLIDVKVWDTTEDGGDITGLTCNFAPLGGPSSGTTWAGPFQVGDSFTCTGTLPAMGTGATHSNTATVTAIGQHTGIPVTDKDPWHSETPLPSTGGSFDARTLWAPVLVLALGGLLLIIARRRRAHVISD